MRSEAIDCTWTLICKCSQRKVGLLRPLKVDRGTIAFGEGSFKGSGRHSRLQKLTNACEEHSQVVHLIRLLESEDKVRLIPVARQRQPTYSIPLSTHTCCKLVCLPLSARRTLSKQMSLTPAYQLLLLRTWPSLSSLLWSVGRWTSQWRIREKLRNQDLFGPCSSPEPSNNHHYAGATNKPGKRASVGTER